jgi:Protein of unknown function (DUF3352)
VRRLLIFLASAACAIGGLSGCGSSNPGTASTASTAATPALQALSYFPPATPFVLTVATAPDSQSIKQGEALERRFPTYAAAATALFARLSQLGIDYNQDVRPLFGNPIALGAVGTSGLNGSQVPPFLAVWVTKSASRLTALVGKLKGLHSTGTYDGAKLYSVGGYAAAITGTTVIFARSAQVLDAALDRHAHGQGVSSAEYASAMTGISPDGLIEIFGDLRNVLGAPGAAKARQVPWVAALRAYGASVSATPRGLTIRFHLDTTGKTLSASELPIASGSAAPGVAGTLPLQAGIRDPGQIIDFIVATLKQTEPASYAKLVSDAAALRRRSGINIGRQANLLTGNLKIASDTDTTVVKAQVNNPSAAGTLLSKLSVPGTAGNGSKGPGLTAIGAGFYTITTSKPKLTIGLVGNELLLGRATPAQLRAFAGAPASGTSSGTGSVSFRIALAQLLTTALTQAPSPTEQQLLGLIGDLTGAASATPSGLTGTATLGLK